MLRRKPQPLQVKHQKQWEEEQKKLAQARAKEEKGKKVKKVKKNKKVERTIKRKKK